jgi:hypothetical protein
MPPGIRSGVWAWRLFWHGRGLLATWILSGIDAMGMKRSLYHRQKCMQVCATQIMLCDKRQCSWPRGPSPGPLHKRLFFGS